MVIGTFSLERVAMSAKGLSEGLSVPDDLLGVFLEFGLGSELERSGDSGNSLTSQSLVSAHCSSKS